MSHHPAYPPFSHAASTPLSALVSPPIPLAAFQPHALSHPPAFPSSASSSGSSSAFGRESGAYPTPHALTSSSLDEGTVYRGVYHAEPVAVAQPPPSLALWGEAGAAFPQSSLSHGRDAHSLANKKLDLPSLSLLASPIPCAPFVHASSPAPSGPLLELAACPAHVERYTSFYSAGQPAVICKALRMGLQNVTELTVDFTEEAHKAKFRGVCYTPDGDSIHFVARVFRSPSSAPAPYLVEFQRRCGDSMAFFRLFQKMVRAMQHVHHGPFEAAFPLPTLHQTAAAPLSALAYSNAPGAVPPPGSHCANLNDGALKSMCAMASGDCVESKREVSKALLQVSNHHDIFPPPPLARSQSVPEQASALDASSALWCALCNLLSSTDGECARLGASILRNCLKRNHGALLLERLQEDRVLCQHLLATLTSPVEVSQDSEDEEGDLLAQREIRRQVAAVLLVLAQKKSAAFIESLTPGAMHIIHKLTQ